MPFSLELGHKRSRGLLAVYKTNTKGVLAQYAYARATRSRSDVEERSEQLMKQERPVETVEDFKLRIAAILHAKPEQIPSPPRLHRLKRATTRKQKRRTRR